MIIFGVKITGFFLFLAILNSFGARLENSMDEAYFGQRVANHNIKKTDKYSIIFIILEIIVNVILNMPL